MVSHRCETLVRYTTHGNYPHGVILSKNSLICTIIVHFFFAFCTTLVQFYYLSSQGD